MSLPPPQAGAPYRVGFVCLGNICRSPMAEAVLTRMVTDAGLADQVSVDSCGTGPWHVGEPMDARAAAHLVAEGYAAEAHRGQQLDPGWRSRDLLLAMDSANLRDAADVVGESDRLRLFRSFDPEAGPGETDVPDPYYGGADGFADVLTMVERTCARLLEELEGQLGSRFDSREQR